ncbi:GFA family glutathione-dependent formaldehyde-activating protein [Rhizobium sp. N541]|uniref:GFA family protein n=1 Tax=unclassified Rhizobium TaxID=2613769 RepID=UPI0007EE7C75|nr:MULTISPECIES: GFA family protein [unclassified Rhizobium]ANM16388.1 GFA family glutathione-dependent formaldehyde-activating protein [Rhizobium sp. N541]ANM22773.1 GFA family glutathione-dependent formaldehyde-activating protein [Rhizobium sp. N941]
MTAQTHTSGGCQCGAVRYRAEGELGYPHLCHCRMCQKAAGNYFMPLGGVMHSNFTLTRGAPKWFQSSDLVRRGFCGDCGTPLFYDIPGTDFINITLGSLDDPDVVKPVMQSNTGRRMSWFHALPGLPVEPEPETPDREDAIAASNHQHPDHDTKSWPLGETS